MRLQGIVIWEIAIHVTFSASAIKQRRKETSHWINLFGLKHETAALGHTMQLLLNTEIETRIVSQRQKNQGRSRLCERETDGGGGGHSAICKTQPSPPEADFFNS